MIPCRCSNDCKRLLMVTPAVLAGKPMVMLEIDPGRSGNDVIMFISPRDAAELAGTLVEVANRAMEKLEREVTG